MGLIDRSRSYARLYAICGVLFIGVLFIGVLFIGVLFIGVLFGIDEINLFRDRRYTFRGR